MHLKRNRLHLFSPCVLITVDNKNTHLWEIIIIPPLPNTGIQISAKFEPLNVIFLHNVTFYKNLDPTAEIYDPKDQISDTQERIWHFCTIWKFKLSNAKITTSTLQIYNCKAHWNKIYTCEFFQIALKLCICSSSLVNPFKS